MKGVVVAALFWLYFTFPAQVVASPTPAAHIDFSPQQTMASLQPGGSQPLTATESADLGFICFVGPFLLVGGLLYSFFWIYPKARQKRYQPPGALLISVAGCALGIIGAITSVVYEIYSLKSSGLVILPSDFLDFVAHIFGIFLVVGILVSHILLITLPRRNPRVFGPRPLRFSWYRFTLFASGGWFVLPVILFVVWAVGKGSGSAPASVILSALFFAVIFSLATIYFAWAFFRPMETFVKHPLSIEQYLTQDPRPPVLYLRPFKMDFYHFASKGEHKSTFENYFCGALRKLGPFIALGNPEDYVPPLGHSKLVGFAGDVAVRLYASDTDWIQKLDELARRSACIVVETARSDNLRFGVRVPATRGIARKVVRLHGAPRDGGGKSHA